MEKINLTFSSPEFERKQSIIINGEEWVNKGVHYEWFIEKIKLMWSIQKMKATDISELGEGSGSPEWCIAKARIEVLDKILGLILPSPPGYKHYVNLNVNDLNGK